MVNEVGEMGEGLIHKRINPMAAGKVSLTTRPIRTLEIGTYIGLLSFLRLPTFVIKQEEPYEGRLSRTVL
ncbi:MAG: hypothetical protein KF687_14585 [Cyclobacteriaceae bacterium]|nr:hypothetical protein [Cyclobacteriaceae bacterium]